MNTHRRDDELDGLLRGEGPDERADLGAALRSLRDTHEEPPSPAVAERHLAAITAAAADAAHAPPLPEPSRRPWGARARRVLGLTAAKVAIGVGAAAAATGTGLAATGNLPDPVQRVVADVAERIGIDLPEPTPAGTPGGSDDGAVVTPPATPGERATPEDREPGRADDPGDQGRPDDPGERARPDDPGGQRATPPPRPTPGGPPSDVPGEGRPSGEPGRAGDSPGNAPSEAPGDPGASGGAGSPGTTPGKTPVPTPGPPTDDAGPGQGGGSGAVEPPEVPSTAPTNGVGEGGRTADGPAAGGQGGAPPAAGVPEDLASPEPTLDGD